MSGRGRKLPNTAYRFTLRLPGFLQPWTQWRNGLAKTRRNLQWQVQIHPDIIHQKTIILSIYISESKSSSERKTMMVRQIKSGFWQKSVACHIVGRALSKNFCPALYSKIIFKIFIFLQAINLHNFPISIISDELFTRGQAIQFNVLTFNWQDPLY